jgi:hypothetical protein
MKRNLYLIITLILFVMAGCSANETQSLTADLGRPLKDENDALTAVTEAEEVVVATAVAEEATMPEKPEAEDVSDEPVPAEVGSGETAVTQTEPVSPVSVDLSQIKPEAPTDSELREMPRPGIPIRIPEEAQQMADDIVADLAQQLSIEASSIRILQWEAVTWRDGSLGCPEPGMAYTGALVNGYRVLLEAQGEQHYYHTDEIAYFIRCDGDNRQEPLGDGAGGDN